MEHLRSQLDAVWPALDPAEQSEVEALFARAVARERAFFDAAYAAA